VFSLIHLATTLRDPDKRRPRLSDSPFSATTTKGRNLHHSRLNISE
jgi:hypothetical protein